MTAETLRVPSIVHVNRPAEFCDETLLCPVERSAVRGYELSSHAQLACTFLGVGRGGGGWCDFTFHLSFVHPLQDVALHQCFPLSAV